MRERERERERDCVCVCVRSLRYAACNTHTPYCHLWPASLYNIFPTLSHKRHDFRKQVTEHKMCVLIFSANLSQTFLILRRNERDMIKNLYLSSCKEPFFCPILMKLEFSVQIFEKILK